MIDGAAAAAAAALLSAADGNYSAPQKLPYPPNASVCVTDTYPESLVPVYPCIIDLLVQAPNKSVVQIFSALTTLHLYKSILALEQPVVRFPLLLDTIK